MFACNVKDTLKIQDVMGGAWVFYFYFFLSIWHVWLIVADWVGTVMAMAYGPRRESGSDGIWSRFGS